MGLIYIMSILVHVFTLFKKGHIEDPSGRNPGFCAVCGKRFKEPGE